MRIAQVAPLHESVPPSRYGGTERIVSYLTEALVHLGHEVTLFASGDSITRARLISPCARSLRVSARVVDSTPYHLKMLEEVGRRIEEFDIVHLHVDYIHFPLSRRHGRATLTTLHGRLDCPDLEAVYEEYPEMPLASISDAQRLPLPWLNWQATVYHGLPEDLYMPGKGDGDYLAFLGRISPEKGIERAIEISARAGVPLRIAAKVDRADQNYFEDVIAPLLKRSPLARYIGEISDEQKSGFLGSALALLFPIDWPEPFGLVMIESMACGTPVIAFKRGSVPEVMKAGVTGYIVESIPGAVSAVETVPTLSRARCRQAFERYYSASRMARDYLKIYERLLEARAREQGVLWNRRRRDLSEERADALPSFIARNRRACRRDRNSPLPYSRSHSHSRGRIHNRDLHYSPGRLDSWGSCRSPARNLVRNPDRSGSSAGFHSPDRPDRRDRYRNQD